MNTVAWLLDADPALRWQALRDLADAQPAEIAAEQARVSHQGLGAAILAHQQADGGWRRADAPVWLSTLFTLLLLKATGIDRGEPRVVSAIARLQAGLGFDDRDGCWELRPIAGGATLFFGGEEEPCINGGVLALGAYFGHPTMSLAQRLLGEQLEDGGWNCEAPSSTRSSFHTTICVLEGLLAYERAAGSTSEIAMALRRGEEYLLQRSLFRRSSTGQVAHPDFLQLSFPPRYRYDVLRALDYFRDAHPGAPPDPRMREAIDYLVSRRQPDGRWILDRAHDEALPVVAGEAVRSPSRWNTLRALRVLRWYEKHA